jgi:predicted metalloprotease with PDZ domain
LVDFRVDIADAHAHLFRVTLTLPRPAAAQLLALPVWIPGSYLVRDFARHLSAFSARQGRRAVLLQQRDKTSWVAACSGPTALVVSYLVYAFDRSVRGAFLDAGRGFFNGSSLFLRAEGREAEPQRLRLGRLPAGWQVATAMPTTAARRFEAGDYDELIDHPFEMGAFWRGRFEAGGVEHEFAVSGAWPSFDGERLLADACRICSTQIRFWHGRGKPPFARYVFLLHAADDAHGGLEHRASTALSAARRELPQRGNAEGSDGYTGLLGLISHEYFHAWNVKRLRPRDHQPLDLGREQPTTLLWFFEGFTAYYDDLLLLQAGLIDRARYLRLLAKAVNAVLASPGRQVQSVAAASFDAWTKHYRSDENTANATVSYYTKGALVALLCDLALRTRSGATLDDAMRALWRRAAGGPLGEDDIAAVLVDLGGATLGSDLHGWVHGTAELPLAAALADVAVAWRHEPATLAARLGLKLSEGAVGGIHVKQVQRGSAAEAAGVAAGDELLAADGWRLRRLDDARQWLGPARHFDLLAVRDQRLLTLRITLPDSAFAPAITLHSDDTAPAAALARRRAWLGG